MVGLRTRCIVGRKPRASVLTLKSWAPSVRSEAEVAAAAE